MDFNSISKKDPSIKFSDFERNKENPFIKQAIEEIDKNIVKRYKSSTGTDKRAVLQAVDPNSGELLGHTSFIRQIEIDEEQFTKFYLSNFKAFFGLSERAIRVFGYILTKLATNSDEFLFFIDECLVYTEYKAKKAVYNGLTELIQAEIIAKGKTDTFFFINPMVVFNGSRVTFAKTYVKKNTAQSLKAQQKELANKNQLDLFQNNDI